MRKGVSSSCCVRRLFKHSAGFSTFISGKSKIHGAKNSSPAAAAWDAICMHYSSLLLIARVRGPLGGTAPPQPRGEVNSSAVDSCSAERNLQKSVGILNRSHEAPQKKHIHTQSERAVAPAARPPKQPWESRRAL